MLGWCRDPAGDNSIDKADIKRLKESGVFGPLSFWVTEIKNLEELGNPNAGVSSCGQAGISLQYLSHRLMKAISSHVRQSSS